MFDKEKFYQIIKSSIEENDLRNSAIAYMEDIAQEQVDKLDVPEESKEELIDLAITEMTVKWSKYDLSRPKKIKAYFVTLGKAGMQKKLLEIRRNKIAA